MNRGTAIALLLPLMLSWAGIDARILAGRRHRQPAKIVRPAPAVAVALLCIGKTAMGQADQRAALPVDQVDLDQARSRRHHLAVFPTKAVGEPVDRHNLAVLAPGHTA